MSKRNLSIILVVAIFLPVFAQQSSTTPKLDPYNPEYAEKTVLVKFADESGVTTLNKASAADALRTIKKKFNITDVKQLFPNSGLPQKRLFKDFKNKEHRVSDLRTIYKIKYSDDLDAKTMAEEIAKLPDVEYAEPDYLVYAMEDMGRNEKMIGNNPSSIAGKSLRKAGATTPNDPLFGQQWYLGTFPGVNAEAAWDLTTGDPSQIIGIIDTGVDWDHADLDDNIWTNPGEVVGNSTDDDANGYTDDIRGWDFVNDDNNPNDDNSHGTHVAGIAAAEGNNGVGICGVAWNAKIMPIKVLQSSGSGSSSDLALGINYAADNGATVINMSLGSYGESLTVKTALENAYSSAVLVAAAGNDEAGINKFPMYPACYGFVLGVEATKQTWDDVCGWNAPFSNFDSDGPIASITSFNYEMKAPGVTVHSTIPNGNYHNLNGTSMACPAVAGAASLLQEYHPSATTEQLFARLIQGANNGILDISNSLNYTLEPDLYFAAHTLIDTMSDCDDDGIADAGETIQLYLSIKNAGGYADSVWSTIRFGEFEDESTANIMDSTSTIGDMSAYSTLTGKSNPFMIEIEPDIANDRDIVFECEIGCKNKVQTIKKNIVVNVINGTELIGVMDTTLILTPDRLWITSSSFRVASTGLLKIKPGTHIKLYNPIDLKGRIEGFGKLDSMICIEGPAVIKGNGELEIEYAKLSGLTQGPFGGQTYYVGPFIFRHCFFYDIGFPAYDPLFKLKNVTLENCDFRYCTFGKLFDSQIGGTIVLSKSNICQSYLGQEINRGLIQYNNIVDIRCNNLFYLRDSNDYPSLSYNNLITTDAPYTNHMCQTYTDCDILDMPNNYWGSIDTDLIDEKIFDFWDYSTYSLLNYMPFLAQPTPLAHGVVWKVLVNGVDPQDETLDPIGTEAVQFDVYFNRAMDTTYVPALTFGVTDPFTQHSVDDNASWSSDSTIWTAYFDVGLETGDGINRIRVSDARDTSGFEIPIEDLRFEFVIQAAGAASNEFIATAGVGEVELEWPTAESPDVLGYNMYRCYYTTDTTFSDTTRINASLVTDTTYTDFDVIPDTTYRYLYKVLGTDMIESDYSKSIAATPVNAASGDANGDLSVSVLDIVSIINYILEENPQPFIFEAADVNSDGYVNVLDIIGVVNIVLGLPKNSEPQLAQGSASLALNNDSLVLENDIPVYGMQFSIKGENLADCTLKSTSALAGFEIGRNETEDRIKVIIYNLTGSTLPEDKRAIFSVQGGKHLEIMDLVVSDRQGNAISTGIGEAALPETFELYPNFPNPFNPVTTIRYAVPQSVRVKVTIYNILGQEVRRIENSIKPAGYHTILWKGDNQFGQKAGSGIYLCHFEAGDFKKVHKMMLIR